MDGKGLSQNAGLGGQTYGGSKMSKLRLRCLTAGWSGELYVWTNPWWGSFILIPFSSDTKHVAIIYLMI
jgi:hypothetical protein